MGIDITQFHQVFYEESFEGLDVMESGLLNLDLAAPDSEEINAIFRAAHSIKGGAGSFGFNEVTDFTHVLETLLDEVRDGKRTLAEDDRALLLSSVDILRSMLEEQRDQGTINMGPATEVKNKLDALLQGSSAPAAASSASSAAAPDETVEVAGWKISFKPHPDLLKTGNDPARMFRELEGLGELSVKIDTSALPSFDDMHPEDCYLSWNLELKGNIDKADIEEVFEWVEDECDLELEMIPAAGSAKSKPAAEDKPAAPAKPAPAAPAAAPKPAAAAASKKPQPQASGGGESSIRVGIDKVDRLINMVGELVITQAMLSELGDEQKEDNLDRLRDGLEQLERNTRELQESVMQIRMLPIGFSFNRFPRLVHDVSSKLGKKVELKILGEHTELDKTVLEKIGDPLVHLVRNSLDHGLETPEIRAASGKSDTGLLELNAYHQGGNIVIKITDDGAGLNTDKIKSKAIERGLIAEDADMSDEEINELIFRAGFSTADQVSDLSGRGVGMDVVKRNIKDLGGTVDVKSVRGEGSTFTIRLPLTLAILDGQLVRIGKQVYIIPLVSIIESLQADLGRINAITGKGELYQLREEYLPIIRLYNAFNITPESERLDDGILVIAEGDGRRAALFVDELLGQQQVVIKSLETNYCRVEGFSGATILGNGQVALILDLAGLISFAHKAKHLKHNQVA